MEVVGEFGTEDAEKMAWRNECRRLELESIMLLCGAWDAYFAQKDAIAAAAKSKAAPEREPCSESQPPLKRPFWMRLF